MYHIENNLAQRFAGQKIRKTPLYYMGGKSKAVKQIYSLIPNTIETLISPFAGGGSVEVAGTGIGLEVVGFDIYRPLIYFWQALKYDKKQLLREVIKLRPVTRESYKDLLETIDTNSTMPYVEQAAAFFALNRSSFMAQIWSGISTNPKNNITDNLIKRLEEFDSSNLYIDFADFHDVLIHRSPEFVDEFLYLDPPYFVSKGTNYYGRSGDLTIFDHIGLFSFLSKLDHWLLSYDNVPEVREMYKDYRQIPLQWIYSNGKGSYTPAEPKEILILSNDIPEVIQE